MLARRSASTLSPRTARMLSQSSTAHSPSFSRTWSEPVPALSSPQIVAMPASSRLPKNFQPVGVSYMPMPSFSATRSAARAGRHRAGDALQAGLHSRAPDARWRRASPAIRGVTKMPLPMIRLRSPSPSEAAPKSGASGAHHLVIEMLGMDEVGIGMVAAEIRQRHEVAHRARPARRAGSRGSPWHRGRSRRSWRRTRMRKPPANMSRIASKSNRRLHQRGIVGDRVDDLDRHAADRRASPMRVEVDVGSTSAIL